MSTATPSLKVDIDNLMIRALNAHTFQTQKKFETRIARQPLNPISKPNKECSCTNLPIASVNHQDVSVNCNITWFLPGQGKREREHEGWLLPGYLGTRALNAPTKKFETRIARQQSTWVPRLSCFGIVERET